jgi:hypothetical protein
MPRLFLQALDPAQTGRWRQADTLCQLDIAQPSILLQCGQDLAVQRIERDLGIFNRQAGSLRYFIAENLAYCGIFAIPFAQYVQYLPI